MKDWIPLIGAFLGFVAGIFGTSSTQRANRRQEWERWKRDQATAQAVECRQLFIEAVEHIEDQMAWLRSLDRLTSSQTSADLASRQTRTSARLKLFASAYTEVAWDDFLEHVAYVIQALELGQVIQRQNGDRSTAQPANLDLLPRALLTGEILVIIIRAELAQEDPYPLLDGLRRRLPDQRYEAAFQAWAQEASVSSSRWFMFYADYVDYQRGVRSSGAAESNRV